MSKMLPNSFTCYREIVHKGNKCGKLNFCLNLRNCHSHIRRKGKGRKNKITINLEANHKRLLNTEDNLWLAGGKVAGGMG